MRKTVKKASAAGLAVILTVALIPVTGLVSGGRIGEAEVMAAEHDLSNPRTEDITNTEGNADLQSTWDCVYFGNYPQSDSTGETAEPVKWRVLSVEGDTALLLADMNLDCQPFYSEEVEMTWEDSTLRTWLNTDFMNAAFSSSEQAAILDTVVTDEGNLYYGIGGGNDTTDKVFCLTYADTLKTEYGFPAEHSLFSETRRGLNTAYAIAQGAWTSEDEVWHDNGWWWLCSPGENKTKASGVRASGNTDEVGWGVDTNDNAVRPALRLDLTSSDWTYAGTVCSDGTVTE